MKILVIGSKGFIGSHVCKHFSAKADVECWGCDVIPDESQPKYVSIDAINSDFEAVFKNRSFDICINCSGAASVPESLKTPYRDFLLNTANVAKILESIRLYDPGCRFINLSSAAVYGNPASLPIKESFPALPVSPYGMHKFFAEELCREYVTFFKLKACSVRIFSAYGPGLQKQLLWDIAVKANNNDSTVNLFGTGRESRDFIYINDIVQALVLILEKGDFDGGVYNVAGGEEITINEVASTLLATLDYKGEIIYSGEERSGDPIHWKADITKIKELGFKPGVTLQEGIKQFAEWFNEKK